MRRFVVRERLETLLRHFLGLGVFLWVIVHASHVVPAQQAEGGTESEAQAKLPAKRVVSVPPEALRAVEALRPAPGFQAQLFAAEPMLANPVAIEIDGDGQVFVCETFRQEKGVEDNRAHMDWVDDDLASRSTADRLAMMRKHLGDALAEYEEHQDRIRLLQDRNGDGIADRSVVFADGFNGPLDGTGAGVLSWRGNVFYACIPKLYAFRDEDGNGKADRKSTMFDGFGIRFAYRGHDLHGLTVGPDGRLYFTIGDRGFAVETAEGEVANRESGAVLRCEMNGDNLEIVATGLRNPQELAFDDFGNLFTADNNSDSGDRARWLAIVDQGDYGWRMAYQYLPDRGPWNREEIWDAASDIMPAYVIPPIANFADGPAGLVAYPGTGLTEDYNGNFFLCDFRGQATASGIRTFKVRPRGASFELFDDELFLWNCLATDVDFGPDGAMYVSDWIEGWLGTGKGRLYRITPKEPGDPQITRQVANVLRRGLADADVKQLPRWMTHADRRVRYAAQFELVRRTDVRALSRVAERFKSQLARVHAIWGLGQIGRWAEGEAVQEAHASLLRLVTDPDAVVRATVVRVLGDNRVEDAARAVTRRMYDDDPQVQALAALAAGRLGKAGRLSADVGIEPLLDLAREHSDQDAVIRHAVATGLAGCASEEQLTEWARDQDVSLRRVALLAARQRRSSAALRAFLRDEDPTIVTEAARAIHDLPCDDALVPLAALTEKSAGASIVGDDGEVATRRASGDARERADEDALLRRALNAHYRLGQSENASALAAFAADRQRTVALRLFALRLLREWDASSQRDRVLGMWRPLGRPHDAHDAVVALREHLRPLMEGGLEVRRVAATMAADRGLSEVVPHLKKLFADTSRPDDERAGFLLSLVPLNPDGLRDLCQTAIADDRPRVRAAGRVALSQLDPPRRSNP